MSKHSELLALVEAQVKCRSCQGRGSVWEQHEPGMQEQLECGECGGTGRGQKLVEEAKDAQH